MFPFFISLAGTCLSTLLPRCYPIYLGQVPCHHGLHCNAYQFLLRLRYLWIHKILHTLLLLLKFKSVWSTGKRVNSVFMYQRWKDAHGIDGSGNLPSPRKGFTVWNGPRANRGRQQWLSPSSPVLYSPILFPPLLHSHLLSGVPSALSLPLTSHCFNSLVLASKGSLLSLHCPPPSLSSLTFPQRDSQRA